MKILYNKIPVINFTKSDFFKKLYDVENFSENTLDMTIFDSIRDKCGIYLKVG